LLGTRYDTLHLCGDGMLSPAEGMSGTRDYLYLPKSLNRPPNANPPNLPPRLSWVTTPFADAVDIIGPARLSLSASSSAVDTDWIVKLQDVAPDGKARDLTQGWLRASHRAIDAARSTSYRPEHGHDRAEALVPGATTAFEIAILPTAHRFAVGHRLGVSITSADEDGFAMQGMTHTGLGMPARNRIFSASRLIVPVVPPA
jgi:predicted acyl esterase